MCCWGDDLGGNRREGRRKALVLISLDAVALASELTASLSERPL
jgi:hypothetical protein